MVSDFASATLWQCQTKPQGKTPSPLFRQRRSEVAVAGVTSTSFAVQRGERRLQTVSDEAVGGAAT